MPHRGRDADVPRGDSARAHPRLDLRLLVPALVAWAGTAATITREPWLVGGLAASCIAAGVVLRARPLAALVLLATGLTLLASAAHGSVRTAGPVPGWAAAGTHARMEGVVLAEPVVLTRPGQDAVTVIVRVRLERVTARGQTARVSSPVLVRGDERWRELGWRDRVRFDGGLRAADPGQREVAVVRAEMPEVDPRPPWLRSTDHMRAGLREACAGLPADSRGLLPGLVVGDTSGTPPELTDAMTETGMSHLSAVSGSNVAVVLACAIGLARVLGLPRRWRPWVAGALLLWFVALARPEPSVIRAATMGAIGLVGMRRSTRAAGLPVLAAAIIALLCADPWLCRSYGFALSSLATLGLLVLVRPWGDAVNRRLPWRLGRRHPWLGPGLALPVAAHVMCAPVVVLLQGEVNVVGILANLVVAPLVEPATLGGVAAALVALVDVRVASWIAWTGGVPAEIIARTARVFADVPYGAIPWPDGPLGAWLLAGLSLLVLLAWPWLAHHVTHHLVVVAALVATAAGAAVPTTVVTWPPDRWRVVVCDVGQGDAIVVRSGPQRAVLVDTGPDPGPVDSCLDRLGVAILDAVVLSHFHADHAGGLAGAYDGRRVERLLTSPVREPAEQVRAVEDLAAEHDTPVSDLVAGDRFSLGEASATVWWPARRIGDGSVPNNASVVLSIRTGEAHAMLTGDVEAEAGRAIVLRMRRDPAMAAELDDLDLLKTPHHGSANLDEEFLTAVAAPEAVVSVGKDNDYGHPTPGHLAVLGRAGSRVHRTDECGDVALVDGDGGLRLVTAR